MAQLPRTGGAKNGKLYYRPPHNACVGALALVSEFGFAFLRRAPSANSRNTTAAAARGRPTLWNTCSLLISCRRPLRSLTRWTMSAILSLSLLSISLVSPIARSRCSRTPLGWLENHPLLLWCDAQKQMRCSPASDAVKVNRPLLEPFWFTIRWSLSNVSSTVMSRASWLLSE